MSKRKEAPESDAEEPPAKREKLEDSVGESKELFSLVDSVNNLITVDFSGSQVASALPDVTFVTKDKTKLFFFRCILGDKKHSSKYLCDIAEKAKADDPIVLDGETAEEINFILNWTLKRDRNRTKWAPMALSSIIMRPDLFRLAQVSSKYDYPELVKFIVDYILSGNLPWPINDLIEFLRGLKYNNPEEFVAHKWLRVDADYSDEWSEHDLICEDQKPDGKSPFWKACTIAALEKKCCTCFTATWRLAPFIADEAFLDGLVARIMEWIPDWRKIIVAASTTRDFRPLDAVTKKADKFTRSVNTMREICAALPRDRGCCNELFRAIALRFFR